jgi:hypothetical protein
VISYIQWHDGITFLDLDSLLYESISNPSVHENDIVFAGEK